MGRVVRLMAQIAVTLACVAGAATMARAHAVLLEAQPADGAVVAQSPAEITLRFDETVTPVSVRVLDAAGHAVQGAGRVTAQDQTVRLPLSEALGPGTYVVSYRVISADSHPVGESLLFAIGPPGTVVGGTRATHPGDRVWQALALVDRAVLDIGFLIAVGGAMFATLLLGGATPPALRRTVQGASAAAVLAAVLGIGIEGGLAVEAPLQALAGAAVWQAGLATGLTRSAALLLVGLVVLAAGLARDGWSRTVLVLLGAGLAASGYSASGHVAIAAPRWLAMPTLWLHVLCVGFWAGSLVPLFRALRGEPGRAAPLVARFGRVALPVVVVLAIAGSAMVWLQFANPDDLVDTPYGRRLSVKLVLVGTLLLVALANRIVLTPRLIQGGARAVAWMRRSIAFELALMVAIVAVTVTLGQAIPPRALAEQARAEQRLAAMRGAPGYAVEIADRGMAALLTVEPAQPGRNRVRLDLAAAGDAPLATRELTLSLANASLGIEPSEHRAVRSGPGSYEIADLPIPTSGTWTFTIAALVDDFDRRIVATEVPIR